MVELETRPSIRDWTKNEYVDHLALHVFEGEDIAEMVYYALRREQNVLMHGEGGYAKSMVAEIGLRMILPEDSFYDGTVFLTSAGPGMATEQFTGYLNMPKFRDEGLYQMEQDETIFLKSRYAILEEGLSAPDKILFSLRDTLTRSKLCVNGTCRTNTLKTMFVCTNVNPDDWVTSMPPKERPSARATLNRFHHQMEVKWPDHSRERFERFFMHQRGNSNTLFAEMVAWANEDAKYRISPRTALQMYDNLIDTGELGSIRRINGLPAHIYKEFELIEARAPYILKVHEVCDFAAKLGARIAQANTPTELNQFASDLLAAENTIRTMTIPADSALSGALSTALRQLSSAKAAIFAVDNTLI